MYGDGSGITLEFQFSHQPGFYSYIRLAFTVRYLAKPDDTELTIGEFYYYLYGLSAIEPWPFAISSKLLKLVLPLLKVLLLLKVLSQLRVLSLREVPPLLDVLPLHWPGVNCTDISIVFEFLNRCPSAI
jgi:hypothetical protein